MLSRKTETLLNVRRTSKRVVGQKPKPIYVAAKAREPESKACAQLFVF
jgi:hypothetical protein